MTLDEAVIADARALVGDLRKRARSALERMSAEELAWRPNGTSNSAGQLALHVCGNLHEAIHVGFAGEAGARDIFAEFEQNGPWDPGEIAARVDGCLGELDAWLAAASPADLLGECVLPHGPKREGRRRRRLRVALSQVTHVAEHLGQIVYVAKLLQGEAFASLSIPRRST